MRPIQLASRVAAPVLTAALVVGLGGVASAATSVDARGSLDAIGQQFSCGTTVLTVTNGTINYSAHITQDSHGVFHATGTDVVDDMTLADDQGGSYTIVGADHFGMQTVDPTGAHPTVATDTVHFVIHDVAGDIAGKVQWIFHLDRDGSMRVLDLGNCEPPN
jgi:hypothetical protein